MLLGSQLEDLKAGFFRLECPHLKLANGSTTAPKTYDGPGEVRLDESGRLELVLYDQEHTVPFDALFPTHQPGTWLSEPDLFDLTAVDLSGATWTAEGLRPDVSCHVERPGAAVRASLNSISCDTEPAREARDWVWLFFAERADTPANVPTRTTVQEGDERPRPGVSFDVWALDVEELDLRLRRSEVGFELNGVCESTLPLGIDTRIEEALWFVLSQPLTPDVVQYRRGSVERIVIHSRGRSERTRAAYPPFPIRHINSADVLSKMFGRYLKHALKYKDERYHPISVLLRKALRAGNGTVEERALALSVSIEGLVSHAFSDLGAADHDVICAVEEAKDVLGELLETSVIKDRLEGCLGSIAGSSPRSALRTLVDQSVLTQSQLEAWETLRHVAAHGREYEQSIQEVYDLSLRLQVMFNRLVFQVIGYQGPYMDYGKVGWPIRSHGTTDEDRADQSN